MPSITSTTTFSLPSGQALPSASGAGAGAMVYVASTTTPGGACIAVSSGTAWKVVVALDAAATVA